MIDFFKDLNTEWSSELNNVLTDSYLSKMNGFLTSEYSSKTIFPAKENIFAAFNYFCPSQTKIVIVGQDPYHGKGEAHGLSFSVVQGVKLPPSLKNIFKAINIDLGIEFEPHNGNLTSWAKQGVLMINSVLTVVESSAASHRKMGWEEFTDGVIKMLNERHEGVVYLLWGKDAWSKESFIDQEKNLILKSVHPSPLSAYRGFFECKHFSQANNYLRKLLKIKVLTFNKLSLSLQCNIKRNYYDF